MPPIRSHLARVTIYVHEASQLFALIDALEDVWGREQNSACATDRDAEERVEHQAIDDHRHVFPVVAVLQTNRIYCNRCRSIFRSAQNPKM